MRSPSRLDARVAIVVQFAALLRCLAEYFTLKWLLGPALTLARIQPFIVGALVAATGTLIAVLFYFGEKWLRTMITAAITVLVLLYLRFTLL